MCGMRLVQSFHKGMDIIFVYLSRASEDKMIYKNFEVVNVYNFILKKKILAF